MEPPVPQFPQRYDYYEKETRYGRTNGWDGEWLNHLSTKPGQAQVAENATAMEMAVATAPGWTRRPRHCRRRSGEGLRPRGQKRADADRVCAGLGALRRLVRGARPRGGWRPGTWAASLFGRVVTGIARTHGSARTRKAAITTDVLRALLGVPDRETLRGHFVHAVLSR